MYTGREASIYTSSQLKKKSTQQKNGCGQHTVRTTLVTDQVAYNGRNQKCNKQNKQKLCHLQRKQTVQKPKKRKPHAKSVFVLPSLTLLPPSTLSRQEGLRSCATLASSVSLVITVGVAVVMVAVTLTPFGVSLLVFDWFTTKYRNTRTKNFSRNLCLCSPKFSKDRDKEIKYRFLLKLIDSKNNK